MANSVALVDVSEINQKVAAELVDAASTLGFVFIEGSDFTAEDVDEVFALSKQFFALPVEEKAKIPITPENYGYSRLNLEVLDPESQPKGDPKEAFNFSQFIDGKPLHSLPDFFEKNKEKLAYFEGKCHALALRLLKLLAIGLKIDETKGGANWFADRHKANSPSGSVLRFLYYHSMNASSPDEKIRAGAHTDYGSLTLLFQMLNQEGLEILSPITKEWTRVPYLPTKYPGKAAPVIVNIADLLSFWTAGVLKSSIHRVRFLEDEQKDRYSIVYFCHPQEEVLLEPVPSPIIAEVKDRGANAQEKSITAHEHLAKRLAATYGWKSEGAQTASY